MRKEKDKILIIILVLFSSCAFARLSTEPIENLTEKVISTSDSVFSGEVLSRTLVKNGLVFDTKPITSVDVIIWAVRITKVYRGDFFIGEVRSICTFFSEKNQEFQMYLEVGSQRVFAGVNTGKYIQIPWRHSSTFHLTEDNNKEILKALKLPMTVSYDKEDINFLYGLEKVKKDVCYDGLPENNQ
jgi:hypothetical protein